MIEYKGYLIKEVEGCLVTLWRNINNKLGIKRIFHKDGSTKRDHKKELLNFATVNSAMQYVDKLTEAPSV